MLTGFIALAAATIMALTAPSASACDQCGMQFEANRPSPAPAATAAPAESAPPPEARADAGRPLPLIGRKASPPRKATTARRAPAATASKSGNQPVARSTKAAPSRNAAATDAAVENANARAQDADLAEAAREEAAAFTDDIADAEVPIVAAEEVNEIDAAAAQNTADALMETSAAGVSPTIPADAGALQAAAEDEPRLSLARVEAAESVTVAESSDGAWSQTSFIGKIFIAIGGFLTAASALRMFIG